ncbi:phage baseplate assembly protein V [Paraburkholderia sp. BR14263]|uniref:phage baseplate assembly protein V n=1 Tax=unclassified Paraburkholderia TaxID=2615204 RepID=UPI0034CE6D5F
MENLFWSLVRSLGRGRLTRVDDSGPTQLVQMQLSANETRDHTPRLAQYGFQSNPPAGSDAIAVFFGGDRTNGAVIACGNQEYRVKGLATGEVCISDNRGQKVYLTQAGIVIDGGGLPMRFTNSPQATLDIPTVHCTGDLNVDGNVTSGKSVTAAQDVADQGGTKTMAGMRETFDGHDHDVPQGGVTSNPLQRME